MYLNQSVLTFIDIQIITGISILISGFWSLQCGLSEYHWQLIVHMAWFSSITHLSALSFLRHYLHNRRKERFWRLVSMFLLLALLSVAVGITGQFSWDEGDTWPEDYAICAFSTPLDSSTAAFQSMVLTVLLLLYGYSIRLAKMTGPFAKGLRELAVYLKKLSLSNEEEWRQAVHKLEFRTFKTGLYQPLWIALLRVAHVNLHLFTSFLAEVGKISLFCVRWSAMTGLTVIILNRCTG